MDLYFICTCLLYFLPVLQIVGTSLDDNACEIDTLTLRVPTILVLGNEGTGVRSHILDMYTTLVKIVGMPKAADSDTACVDSLNVSVTGGIILYHILKNKDGQKLTV
jgi:21S rRNA (GM2251-2'-O)-methyltransferase